MLTDVPGGPESGDSVTRGALATAAPAPENAVGAHVIAMLISTAVNA
ncbi:hypothetical protein [Streptomyces neyagawaensis]|uniref:Uncharacterized protein n=1 Tax=Streptomyces neyagawaensis TaxID=42238 RepID=A0ABV3ASH2_9ACTN